MEKKNVSKGGNAIVAIILMIAIFSIATFNIMCFDNAGKVVKHNAKNTELVEAVVTKVNEHYDNDTGYYWNVLVSYTYDGVEYKDVFYDTYSSEQTVGKTVSVTINPDLPDEIVPDEDESAFSTVATVIILTVIIVILYIALAFLITLVTAKLGCENVHIPTFLPIAILSVKQTIESVYFYKQYESFIYAIFSAIPIILLIVVVSLLSRKKSSSAKDTK